MIKYNTPPQFIIFLITGGISALINFLSCLLYQQYWNFSISVVLSYLTGMISAFFLAKIFVFKASCTSVTRSIFLFTLINILGLIQTLGVSLGFRWYLLPMIGVVDHSHEIAHGIGVAIPMFSSYFGHKFYSFK